MSCHCTYTDSFIHVSNYVTHITDEDNRWGSSNVIQKPPSSPPAYSPSPPRSSPLRVQLAAAAAAQGGLLSAQSSGDLGPAYRTDSADSQSPLLSRLLEPTSSLTETELTQQIGTSFFAARDQQSPAQQHSTALSAAAVHAGSCHPLQGSVQSMQSSPPRQIAAAPVLAAIHTSSSHPLQEEGFSSGEASPSSSLSSSPRQQRKQGSTRFAVDESGPAGMPHRVLRFDYDKLHGYLP